MHRAFLQDGRRVAELLGHPRQQLFYRGRFTLRSWLQRAFDEERTRVPGAEVFGGEFGITGNFVQPTVDFGRPHRVCVACGVSILE